MIYFHVPFCRSFCTYCGFYSEICPRRETQQVQNRFFEDYADAVCKEIEARSSEIAAARQSGAAEMCQTGSRTASDPSQASLGPSLSRAEGGTSLLDPLPTGLTAETVGALYEVQTFYEKMFLEQGYKITYLSFVIDHDGPYEHPTDFDEDYWRSVEGPRLLFGHDSAETRRQKLHSAD